MENQHKMITGYRDLSEDEIKTINDIKEQASSVELMMDKLRLTPEFDQRCVSLAITKFQEGFMWAIRSVAQPTSFG